MSKFVYLFSEADKDMRELLGGKGANLGEMTRIGLPVPFGFTITTEACNDYYRAGKQISEVVEKQIYEALEALEKEMGKKLGDPKDPLLVSVRSGAVFSMPGMMDTILNLGLNDEAVEGLAALTDNPRFAYDSYRRFIQMFSNVVLELDMDNLKISRASERKKGYKLDIEMTADDWKQIVMNIRKLLRKILGKISHKIQRTIILSD